MVRFPKGEAPAKTDVPQGTLDLLVLTILRREPLHGYGISQRLTALTAGTFRVNPGSLFPALYALERDGKLRCEEGLYWPVNVVVMLALLWCGWWTVLRHGGTLPRAGLQTMKMGLVAGVPYFLLALLIWSGALGVVVLGPGDAPTTFTEHGFAIGVYGTDGSAAFIFTPLGLVVTHLLNLVDCWIFGAIGGAIGRALRHRPLPPIPIP